MIPSDYGIRREEGDRVRPIPPLPSDVEGQIHALLRMLAGEPMDEITMTRAEQLLAEAKIAATLEWARASYQFRVVLPDGREFLSPAPDAMSRMIENPAAAFLSTGMAFICPPSAYVLALDAALCRTPDDALAIRAMASAWDVPWWKVVLWRWWLRIAAIRLRLRAWWRRG